MKIAHKCRSKQDFRAHLKEIGCCERDSSESADIKGGIFCKHGSEMSGSIKCEEFLN